MLVTFINRRNDHQTFMPPKCKNSSVSRSFASPLRVQAKGGDDTLISRLCHHFISIRVFGKWWFLWIHLSTSAFFSVKPYGLRSKKEIEKLFPFGSPESFFASHALPDKSIERLGSLCWRESTGSLIRQLLWLKFKTCHFTC